ncbi:MAG: DMT family transporter, partial [Pseudomonadota bacterium]
CRHWQSQIIDRRQEGRIANAHDVSLQDWGLIAAMSAFGFASQFCFIYAMSIGDASFLSPIDYLRLPMSAVADFWVFRLIPGVSVWVGAAIIVISTLYIGWRERRNAKMKS